MPEDDHVVEPPATHLDLAETPITLRHGTVRALRAFMLTVEPQLRYSIDRFIEQAQELTTPQLRVIASDPIAACEELGVFIASDLIAERIQALTNGELDDRQRRFSTKQTVGAVVLAAVLSAFFSWLVTFLSVRGG